MKPKPTTEDRRIGEIVVEKLNKTLFGRFRGTALLRSEAQQILIRCSEEDLKAWEDVFREYNLPRDREYKILHKTKKIVLAGYRS